jgi:hypothetical protein
MKRRLILLQWLAVTVVLLALPAIAENPPIEDPPPGGGGCTEYGPFPRSVKCNFLSNQFNGAVNLGVGSRGIYVADTGNNRVQAFTPVSGVSPTPFTPRLALSIQFTPALNQPNAVAPVADFLEEKLYIADTGNNRVILVKLPSDTPEGVWNEMKQHLHNKDIPGAIPFFSICRAQRYWRAFLSIGAESLQTVMDQTPTISAVVIEGDSAQYRFDQSIRGQTITFPIEFVKENGIWKILEY